MACHVEGETELSLSVTWAVPVKVEDLKASLRASVVNAGPMCAFQLCVKKANENCSMSRMPQELIDMIKDFAFSELRAKLQRQWRIIYQCSTEIQDKESFRTIVRYAVIMKCLRIPKNRSYCQECPWCKEKELVRQDPQYDPTTTSDGCREPCRALVDFALRDAGLDLYRPYNPVYWCEQLEKEDPSCLFEDKLVCPISRTDVEELVEESHDFFSDESWYEDTANWLAQKWEDLLDGKGLFTKKERRLLNSYGLSHVLIRSSSDSPDEERRQTTALLIPQTTDHYKVAKEPLNLSRRTARSVALMKPSRLGKKQRKSLVKAFRELQLEPCDTLIRDDRDRDDSAEEDNYEGPWPQPVALAECQSICWCYDCNRM